MKKPYFKIVLFAIILAFTFTACGEESDELVGFVWIPARTFTMGSPAGLPPTGEPDRASDETQHWVTISKGFYMSKYAITQGQYFAFMELTPSYFPSDDGKARLPVEGVNWYEAIEFCNKLSENYGLEQVYEITGITRNSDGRMTSATVTPDWTKNGYRLPTEAEWEYACRAGTTTPFSTGNNITTDQANYNGNYPYNGNPTGTYRVTTIVVGSFAPNAWGLYDMHGNVYEWCWDWYGTYPGDGEVDYRGPGSGTNRVLRGGSWAFDGRDLRSASRSYFNPGSWGRDVGFRVVRP